MIKCVVNFSGGSGSYVAATRAIERFGADQVELLFSDTKTEDEDLYRFLDDCERVLPSKLVRIADGRDIWQVFNDVRFIGSSRVATCSRILKKEICGRWLAEHASSAVRVFGIDMSESHRAVRLKKTLSPVEVWCPLLDKPYLTKAEQIAKIEQDGIEPPRLYALGAPHNNCGGACVKAGMAHFRWLYHALPCVYSSWERHEEELRVLLGDVSILRDRKGGVTTPLTLREFRKQIEANAPVLWEEEWGGCGCFVDS